MEHKARLFTSKIIGVGYEIHKTILLQLMLVCLLLCLTYESNTSPTRLSNFTIVDDNVYHMEMDQFKPGFIVYSDENSLKTSRGFETYDIVGSRTNGYREGIGGQAKFNGIYGFVQILADLIVVVDNGNDCLRLVDRTTRRSMAYIGRCVKYGGFVDGKDGRFNYPWSIIRNKKNRDQLLLADTYAVRIVNIHTQEILPFVKSSDKLMGIRYLVQDDVGDLFVTVGNQIFKISYALRSITHIAGGRSGYEDATLRSSRFSQPRGLLLVGKDTLLVADHSNREVRVLNLRTDNVKKLRLCPRGSLCLQFPTCLLMNGSSLYIGQKRSIVWTDCEW